MREANAGVNEHYNANYYKWYRPLGEFCGKANLIKFQEFIRLEHHIFDFGAGGGFLLANLTCASKVGVELNAVAREDARSRGLTMVESVNELEDESFDVAISNSALEHVDFPLLNLREIFKKLRPGGLAVFMVPCESRMFAWAPNDINFHLYSWSPMCIGNLFTRAGFQVIESKPFCHLYLPKARIAQKILGWKLFHAGSRLWALVDTRITHIRCVARKPVGKSISA